MIREYIVKISDEVMEDECADSPPELVRCKDCKYWDRRTSGCMHLTGSIAPIVKTNKDWFCADGERRNVD